MKIGGNEFLEIFSTGTPQRPAEVYRPLDAIDGRARLLLDLVKAWGAMTVLGDLMSGAMCEAHSSGNPMEAIASTKEPKETVDAFVMRCAQVVDACYDEVERRGWLIKLAPTPDETD